MMNVKNCANKQEKQDLTKQALQKRQRFMWITNKSLLYRQSLFHHIKKEDTTKEKENKRLQRPVIKLFDIMSIYVEFKWNTRLLAQVEIVFLFYFYWQKWKLCEFVVQLERSYLCSMT